MQLYRVRDKANFELVMLFEKEVMSNTEATCFYRKLMDKLGDGSKEKFEFVL